jgi:hypothetical protein
MRPTVGDAVSFSSERETRPGAAWVWVKKGVLHAIHSPGLLEPAGLIASDLKKIIPVFFERQSTNPDS